MVGSSKIEQYDNDKKAYVERDTAKMSISAFFNAGGNYVLNMDGKSKGKFRFTGSDTGSHSICMLYKTDGYFGTRAVLVLNKENLL